MAGPNSRSVERDDNYFILVEKTCNDFYQDIRFQFSMTVLIVPLNYESISQTMMLTYKTFKNSESREDRVH